MGSVAKCIPQRPLVNLLTCTLNPNQRLTNGLRESCGRWHAKRWMFRSGCWKLTGMEEGCKRNFRSNLPLDRWGREKMRREMGCDGLVGCLLIPPFITWRRAFNGPELATLTDTRYQIQHLQIPMATHGGRQTFSIPDTRQLFSFWQNCTTVPIPRFL